jgi:hypothetical protein
MLSNTEEDDDSNNDELANQVESDPGLPNSLQTTEGSSSNHKGKQKASLECGCLSVEDKKEIAAFSSEVLGMAQVLADHLRMLRNSVLISADLDIKEFCCENITNLHA